MALIRPVPNRRLDLGGGTLRPPCSQARNPGSAWGQMYIGPAGKCGRPRTPIGRHPSLCRPARSVADESQWANETIDGIMTEARG